MNKLYGKFIFLFLFVVFLPIAHAANWNLADASYTDTNKDLGTNAFDIEFNTDGTKLYVPTGTQGDKINEYTLSTPWDISTATLNYSLSVSDPTSLNFSSDGTKMYYITFYSGTLLEYSLSTPWDISTATSTGESQGLAYGNNYGGSFDRTGEYFYALNSYDDKVHQYSLSTPWDLSTSTSDNKTFSITYSYYYRDIVFNSDKSKFYIVSDLSSPNGSEKVREFTLSNPDDISTASYNSVELDISGQMTYPTGIYIKGSGDTFYISSAYETPDLHKYQFSEPDTINPVISTISASPSDNSATITWTTDEEASSQVEYGLTASYGNETTESDTATRVTSHSVDLSSLSSCARYYYRVKSKDASTNQAISSQGTFVTTGCAVSNVTSGEESEVDKDLGGSINLTNSNTDVTLTIPVNFYSSDGTIQINILDSSSVNGPTSKSMIDANIYELLAIDGNNDPITSFDNEITVVFEYSDSDVSSFDESTLDAYKYSGGDWVAQNCTVDASANTVTCTLSSFSVYGVFGSLSSNNSSAKNFSEDKRCHWNNPESTTWVKLEPTVKNGVVGMLLTWTQYNANKIDIYIDDSTGSYPWKIANTSNDGHEFLANVASWQNIRIKPKNHCSTGDSSIAVSYDSYPFGWFSIAENVLGAESNLFYTPVDLPTDYTVTQGDSLWNIAYKFYGDGTKYRNIMDQNNIGKELDIGQVLTIPKIN